MALTGYGRDGPGARLPGYDALIQAEAGWASLTGAPDGPPTKSGLSLADYICGLTAALGLVVALLDARRTGRGRDVDTNLYDSALAMLSYPATWFLSSGFVTERHEMSAHPSVVPFQFFATADGHIAIASPKEKFFHALVDGMDLGELSRDPRFADFEGRGRHRAELLAILPPGSPSGRPPSGSTGFAAAYRSLRCVPSSRHSTSTSCVAGRCSPSTSTRRLAPSDRSDCH